MVWVALLYAAFGTWLAHVIGKPLVRLNFRQQQVEADFRYALVRFRDSAEGVALHRGEAEERAGLARRFHALVENWWALMTATKRLTFATAGYTQVALVFPFVVAAPAFFAGRIPLGGLTQTAQAFGEVQGALSWIVDNYARLAEWRATVARLAGFRDAIAVARAADPGPVAAPGSEDALAAEGLRLALPDGRVLLEDGALRLAPGERVLLTGASGSGKSTLFRALAGIWPFGAGRVATPREGGAMFLPQRPYIPLGTLRRALAYPTPPEAFSDAELHAALEDAGLAHLAPRLDAEEPWAQRLSGGEQQRVALARVLLNRPRWLFLDEATASLDPAAMARFHALIAERLPGTAVLAIAHGAPPEGFYGRRLRLEGGRLA
jgi:putative ATP-binding cassette transporter